MNGDIMSVSRLRMATDGQGVSTLVAFFGCPLNCKYCINNCCHEGDSVFSGIPRAAYKPEELLEVLKKDEIYYLMTGGGVVFGGGEPLLQSVFIYEVCKLMDARWAKRVETSLNVPWRNVEPLIDDIDEWIIDIKDMDRFIYEEYTGVNNEKVIQNLYRLRDVVPVERLHIRVPNIPGYNTKEDVRKSVEWIKDVLGVEPEIFDYYALPHTVKETDWLRDDGNYTEFSPDSEVKAGMYAFLKDGRTICIKAVVNPGHSYRGRDINKKDLLEVEFLHSDISSVADEICKNVTVE